MVTIFDRRVEKGEIMSSATEEDRPTEHGIGPLVEIGRMRERLVLGNGCRRAIYRASVDVQELVQVQHHLREIRKRMFAQEIHREPLFFGLRRAR